MMHPPDSSERRSVQRVGLTPPLRATIGATRIYIVDLSLRGLRVTHQDDIGPPSTSCVVHAEWDGRPMDLHCVITRTTLHRAGDERGGRATFHSGLSITEVAEASAISLRRLIEYYVERALDEQKANARGIPAVAPQSVPTGPPSAFVRHEYIMGRWMEVITPSPIQPDSGFTISAQHSRAEVDMLRRAYESASTANDIAIIRRLAALSVSSPEGVPARRYVP